MIKFPLNMFLLVLPLLLSWLKLCQSKKLDAISDKKFCGPVIEEYLQAQNITINMENYIESSPLCPGICCDKVAEHVLIFKSSQEFSKSVQNHIKTHRRLWALTLDTFREHISDLMHHSENRTINLLYSVYSNVESNYISLLQKFYNKIWGYFISSNVVLQDNIENTVNLFFKNLFPLAYLNIINASDTQFQSDYYNCLVRTYDHFEPFGTSSFRRQISEKLYRSVAAASAFKKALLGGVEILEATEQIEIGELDKSCKEALFKMSYCSSCQGYNRSNAKPCYSYCINVMRGCLNIYMGPLTKDWRRFVEAVQNLYSVIRSEENGIEPVIKGLDNRISEAIMYFMKYGPTITEKITHACGNPTFQTSTDKNDKSRPDINDQNKWPSPVHIDMLNFMATIERQQDFFMRISDSLCEEDEFKRNDSDCWMGSHMGTYQHSVVELDQQKYNPEVQISLNFDQTSANKLLLLNDQLISIRDSITKPIIKHPKLPMSDNMLADMADAEGSGYNNSVDDVGYDDDDGSGEYSREGSGENDYSARNPSVAVSPGDSHNNDVVISKAIVINPIISIVNSIIFVMTFLI